MKKLVCLLLTILFILPVMADNTVYENWDKGGKGALQFSQAALKNWSAGGENALALNMSFNYFMNYDDEKLSWKNNLDVAYGLQIKGGESQKTDDKIDFTSDFGYEAGKNWNYSLMYGFKTQMTNGYADTAKISTFMAPAYMLISAGMAYIPGEKFSFLISPVTGKMTFVLDPLLSAAGSFGVDAGKKSRAEFGGFAKIGFKTDIMENVNFDTKCELFANYFAAPFSVDVNWDIMLGLKVNDFLSANISTQLIYDRDVTTAIQFKEIFTFGLSFDF